MPTTIPHPPPAAPAAPAAKPAGPPQHSPRRIAAVWAAAALPMAFMAWVAAPWLAHRLDGPNQLPKALLLTLTAGLIWQFVIVVALVAREQRSLRWPVV